MSKLSQKVFRDVAAEDGLKMADRCRLHFWMVQDLKMPGRCDVDHDREHLAYEVEKLEKENAELKQKLQAVICCGSCEYMNFVRDTGLCHCSKLNCGTLRSFTDEKVHQCWTPIVRDVQLQEDSQS